MEEIKIVTRNLEMNQDIKNYIDKKFSKITRYVPKVSSLEITLKKEKYTYSVNVLIHTYHKKIIKLSTKDKSLHSAIDAAVDKIKEILVKYKEKTIISNKKHSKIRKDEFVEDITQKSEDYEKDKIYLEKMTENQAVERLSSMNEEDFLIFFNIDTNTISLAKKYKEKIKILDILDRKE